MRIKLIASLFLSATCVAKGPQLHHDKPAVQREFENVYQDITFPVIKSGVATNLAVSSLTATTVNLSSVTVSYVSVSTITATSATITNLAVTGAFTGVSLGKVRQVVIGSTTTAQNSTSTSFADTGLSVSITPTSASNTILIIVLQSVGGVFSAASNTVIVDLQLLRGASVIHGPRSVCRFANLATSSEVQFSGSLVYIDSPATTSATTYKTQFARNSGANAITHRVQGDSTASYILAAEVAP